MSDRITELTMMVPLLEACPSFAPQWTEFLEEWSTSDDKPLYIVLGTLACHCVAMLAAGDVAGLSRVFAVVERWHLEGDSFVKQAATIGFLETLQNTNIHESTTPEQFEPFLLPESSRWWRKVERFWEYGELITDD
jgi:hypothetical protein